MSGLRIGGRGRGPGDIGCAEAEELAPDLALGLLDGAERAAVLAHVDRCPSCRADVASLTELGEQLLLLVPETSPPAELESDVLAQIAPERRQRRRRRSRRALGAVAAALLALAGLAVLLADLGGGGDVGDGGGGSTVAAVGMAEMRSRQGEVVGEAILLQSSSDMQVSLHLQDWLQELYEEDDTRRWSLTVHDTGGRRASYPMPFDGGPNTVTLDADTAQVTTVAVVDQTGRAWCSGTFVD